MLFQQKFLLSFLCAGDILQAQTGRVSPVAHLVSRHLSTHTLLPYATARLVLHWRYIRLFGDILRALARSCSTDGDATLFSTCICSTPHPPPPFPPSAPSNTQSYTPFPASCRITALHCVLSAHLCCPKYPA